MFLHNLEKKRQDEQARILHFILTSTITRRLLSADADTLALCLGGEPISTALTPAVTERLAFLGALIVIKPRLPLVTRTHVHRLTAHVLPAILTTLSFALLLRLESVSVATGARVRKSLTRPGVSVEEVAQLASRSVPVIAWCLANRHGLAFILAVALGKTLVLGLKVVSVAQAVAVLEHFAASSTRLVVPTVNDIVARPSEGRQGTGV